MVLAEDVKVCYIVGEKALTFAILERMMGLTELKRHLSVQINAQDE